MSKAALTEYLFERIAAAMREVPAPESRDTYAFYLVLSLDEAGGFRPSITSLAWLTRTDMTPEKISSYGSAWSPWAASSEVVLALCDEERDPHGFALLTQQYESLLSHDEDRQRWTAFTLGWPHRWTKDDLPGDDQARFTAILDSLEIPASDRQFLSSVLHALRPFDLSQAFFPIVASSIRRLFVDSIVEGICGRTVPIGVMHPTMSAAATDWNRRGREIRRVYRAKWKSG